MNVKVVFATAEHGSALAELFRAAASGCFCRFWHFEGDKNAWLERCALEPEKNEAEMRAELARGEVASSGLVAIGDDDAALGWMKLAPRATLPKLRARPVYRKRDLGPDDGVLSIGCMLVRPDARRHGVARALVVAATAIARDRGAKAIEAYPHDVDAFGADATDRAPEQMWMGPASVFRALGYRVVAGELPYPVLRLDLR